LESVYLFPAVFKRTDQMKDFRTYLHIMVGHTFLV